MSALVLMVAKFGFPTIAAAAAIYILLHSEVQFRYSRGPKPPTE
jgi:hypothetical protein